MASSKCYRVERCWSHSKQMLAYLEGVSDRNGAESMKGQKIWIEKSAVIVAEDDYLYDDLIGCQVCCGGLVLGAVAAVEAFGAQDNLLIVTNDETTDTQHRHGEWLLPFIEDVVVNVDLKSSIIEVSLLDGMDVCFTPKS